MSNWHHVAPELDVELALVDASTTQRTREAWIRPNAIQFRRHSDEYNHDGPFVDGTVQTTKCFIPSA